MLFLKRNTKIYHARLTESPLTQTFHVWETQSWLSQQVMRSILTWCTIAAAIVGRRGQQQQQPPVRVPPLQALRRYRCRQPYLCKRFYLQRDRFQNIRIKILRKIFLKLKILWTQSVKKQKIVIAEREQKENHKAIQLFGSGFGFDSAIVKNWLTS